MTKQDQRILDIMESDYKAAENIKNENDAKVQAWLDIYHSKPYGNEVKFKSQYVSSIVKQAVGWQLPSLVEPFTSEEGIITCEPVSFEDVNTAEQGEKLLNYQFARNFDRYSFIVDVAFKILTEGTCFTKTSWEFEERTVTEIEEYEQPVPMDPAVEAAFMEEMQQNMMMAEQNGEDPAAVQQMMIEQIPTEWIQEEVEKVKVIKNRPTEEICELSDLRIDPTCRGIIKNAQFITHDFETDISSLKKDGRYKNLDLLIDNLQKDETYVMRDNVDDSFEFSDDPRKKIIVHEYWGNIDVNEDGIAEPIVGAWVNGILIRLDDNPLDDGTKPFKRAVYTRRPGYIYGEPLAALMGDRQRIDSVIHRGIFDDMKRSNSGQRGYKKGFTDAKNMKRFEQGKDFEYNTSYGDVYEAKYTGLSNSIFEVMNGNKREADAMTGVKSFDHGTGGNALGSTAAAVTATTTSSAKREMLVIRGLAEELIIPMMQIWLSYDALFLEEEEVIRITNKEFDRVKRDDLDGNIDIKMSIATQEAKAMKADRLAFLMQTTGQSLGEEKLNVIIAGLMDLNDMPDLAEQIRTMEPQQPSPEQQEVQALQIELLKAQVQNEYAKAKENEIDYELKSAKTQNELAKARSTDSDADLKDLDFLMKDEGEDIDREERLEGARTASKIQLEREKAQGKAMSPRSV